MNRALISECQFLNHYHTLAMNKIILNALKGNDLVIVIGNELSMLKLNKKDLPKSKNPSDCKEDDNDQEQVLIHLKEYLAHRLWVDYYDNKALLSPHNLSSVIEHMVKSGDTTEDDIKADIIRIVKNFTDEQIVLEPLQKLARIGNIDTILSVNFDHFLERAFEAENRKINKAVNFSIQNADSSDEAVTHDKALCRIFNLMGSIHGSDFALTEEMQLEYMYNLLLSKEKDANSKALFKAVHEKSILFIGCNFPNWFMRFFIRTIAKKRLKTGRKKFVASDHTTQDMDLAVFLENNQTSVIPIGQPIQKLKNADEVYKDTIEFIDELYEKTQQEKGIQTDFEPKYEEKVFLSYSWADKALITKLKNEFDKCGVELFFDDDDLRNGESYDDSIRNYINTCDFILPMISENSISNKESYVYEKEWIPAIHVEQFRRSSGMFREGQENYIRPYIIDKTEATDDRIPEEIRKRNITSIGNEDDFGPVVRKFIKDNNLTEKPN